MTVFTSWLVLNIVIISELTLLVIKAVREKDKRYSNSGFNLLIERSSSK